MMKILTLLLGFGLTVPIGAVLFAGMAFSGEAHRGRHGDATSTFCMGEDGKGDRVILANPSDASITDSELVSA